MSIGSRIKQARELAQMSRRELATAVGVTPSAISNYENDISSPKDEVLYKIINVLGVDANFIFQDEMAKPSVKSIDKIIINELMTRGLIKKDVCISAEELDKYLKILAAIINSNE